MGNLSEELLSQLNPKISFTIPIFGGVPIGESVVVTWIIMLVLVVASILLTRNLKIVPNKRQACMETIVGGINNFFEGILGEEGKVFIPYLGTIALYIGVANIIGLFGLPPPTKELNTTAGLAFMSVVLIYGSGLWAKGFRGWLKSFAEPMALVAPLNVLEILIRPLSLCMRLFGNVLGSFVIMELIKIVAPLIIPIPLSMYFDIFDGLIQAFVFVFLTALFLRESIE